MTEEQRIKFINFCDEIEPEAKHPEWILRLMVRVHNSAVNQCLKSARAELIGSAISGKPRVKIESLTKHLIKE